ncbi:enhancer of mRNA-decapping protein 3-like [Brienomyrus brachyistius]|uniref:enhancer of mRNA-decapping protein 3-like n=1 Tax=Brienomyrus brachyistius TaxID=42636 RepID=UPI0020B2B642|nr:enhancer of mRNA-decapping protein 3-like [Brienomyrus brachyistius]XP_048825281.1 enhancer of mRNA-decapping protein 3-like [Brienomyrus brachyistius]
MAADWLGSLVSINCGPTLGVYQGEVSSVDQSSQTISLRQPFHNGIRCPVPEVTFSAMDIKELKILDIRNGTRPAANPAPIGHSGRNGRVGSQASSAPLPVPHRGEPRSSEGLNSPQQCSKSYGERHLEGPGQAKVFRRRHNSWSSSSRGVSQATPKKNGAKNGVGGGAMKMKDDECFGDGTDEGLDTDFDFEGNLALFDKAAVFSEINTLERRGNGARAPGERTPSRYRHDENILEGVPVVYRQIAVPQPGGKEYCTDSGLVVPSIPYELHKRLLAEAERLGLSLERRLEMTGVCASQMALTLLGGPNRLTPKNVHQRPTVVLLCGPHVQGAQGIGCGRHLANHGVEVVLFLPNFVKMLEAVTVELALFGKTGGQQVSSVRDLPDGPVDLVVNCLDCHENAFLREQPWYRAAADWANQNRAPVLSIDPPVSGREQAVEAKWSLSLGLPLPLAESAGRVYLCDIGLPRQVFPEVGITYRSPFGCKFVIPLHPA